MIEGVTITPLQIISIQVGDVMHGMKNDDVGFSGFGEAYFSLINSGAIKGWKRHREMVCNFIVPSGKIKVVVFDDKIGHFDEFILSFKIFLISICKSCFIPDVLILQTSQVHFFCALITSFIRAKFKGRLTKKSFL